ncbi:hypothetical protein EIK56_18060 [Sphingomonas sp. C8-2]|nr:hypothetical protein EIK56_18060 [Sphingomonas sp. C8-2]
MKFAFLTAPEGFKFAVNADQVLFVMPAQNRSGHTLIRFCGDISRLAIESTEEIVSLLSET